MSENIKEQNDAGSSELSDPPVADSTLSKSASVSSIEADSIESSAEVNSTETESIVTGSITVEDFDAAAILTPAVTELPVDCILLCRIIEGALLAAHEPLSTAKILSLFDDHVQPDKETLDAAFETLALDVEGRGYRLVNVASGWRFQICEDLAPWVNRLWEEKPQKYSRALLETIALIAYRQPITRGDIEEVRGVAVSSHIVKTLLEREWVKVVGHRDVPGRPALYATTKQFLDYFGLKNLEDLPSLSELKDIESLNETFEFNDPEKKSTSDQTVSINNDAGDNETGTIENVNDVNDVNDGKEEGEASEDHPQLVIEESTGDKLSLDTDNASSLFSSDEQENTSTDQTVIVKETVNKETDNLEAGTGELN